MTTKTIPFTAKDASAAGWSIDGPTDGWWIAIEHGSDRQLRSTTELGILATVADLAGKPFLHGYGLDPKAKCIMTDCCPPPAAPAPLPADSVDGRLDKLERKTGLKT